VNLRDLKVRVARADYVVDPEAVAEAMLRRVRRSPARRLEAIAILAPTRRRRRRRGSHGVLEA
jgi:hypothetical protein